MNYYYYHIGDFDRATRHLSRLERSVYRDLLDVYYDTECQLTLDLPLLCRKIIARTNEEVTAVEQVLNEFFTKTPTGWYHQRCEEELDAYRNSNSQKSLAGKASAAKRALKRQEALNDNPTGVEQPCNGTPTNQEPITNNQEPDIKPFVLGDAEYAKKPGSAKQECPHQAIIALYHERLPQCPAIRDWTPARATQLRARWNESPDRQNLNYWGDLFDYIGTCDFLVGKGTKIWFADLEWITKSKNFTKIREGKYESR